MSVNMLFCIPYIVVNLIQHMIQSNVRNYEFSYLNVYGGIDDLYQKIELFSNLKLYFSIRSIRLSTVCITRYRSL